MTDDLDFSARAAGAADGDAVRAQRRLKDLLVANATIVQRLDLETVLRHIVEAAMTLVDARYGALGVTAAHDNEVERFIYVGIDEKLARHIGHPPRGKGLLGAVITERAAIRLTDIADDPRSIGFPPAHPGMTSFLGVPVHVGEQIYGNLYLTESRNGAFSADDEELVVALAATAGIAIENARLYDNAKTREDWSTTTADVMAAMLGMTGENVLEVIAEHIGTLINVDLVAIVVPDGDDDMRIATIRGSGSQDLLGRVFPVAGTLAARALETRRAASVDGEDRSALFEWQTVPGPTIAIPLFTGDEPLGVLAVARRARAAAFTDADLDMAFAFAGQAGIAIEVVRARDDRGRLETARDRARIARDLHDHVIQRLFGAGLSLQAVSATVDAEASASIETQVDAIDAAIKDIRTVIFALGSAERARSKLTRDRLLGVVSDMAQQMRSTPRITFSGPLDSLVDSALTEELMAVLRECLTNIVRHAHAHAVEIAVGIADGEVTLCVQDDGRGIPESAVHSGLTNISERAQLYGGRCTITSRPEGGTRVEWIVPTDDDTDVDEAAS